MLPASELSIWLSIPGTVAEPSCREGNICQLPQPVIKPTEAELPMSCQSGKFTSWGKRLHFWQAVGLIRVLIIVIVVTLMLGRKTEPADGNLVLQALPWSPTRFTFTWEGSKSLLFPLGTYRYPWGFVKWSKVEASNSYRKGYEAAQVAASHPGFQILQKFQILLQVLQCIFNPTPWWDGNGG